MDVISRTTSCIQQHIYVLFFYFIINLYFVTKSISVIQQIILFYNTGSARRPALHWIETETSSRQGVWWVFRWIYGGVC